VEITSTYSFRVYEGTALPLHEIFTSNQKYSAGIAADLWFDSNPEDGGKSILRKVVNLAS
jgi:hypothetical protein